MLPDLDILEDWTAIRKVQVCLVVWRVVLSAALYVSSFLLSFTYMFSPSGCSHTGSTQRESRLWQLLVFVQALRQKQANSQLLRHTVKNPRGPEMHTLCLHVTHTSECFSSFLVHTSVWPWSELCLNLTPAGELVVTHNKDSWSIFDPFRLMLLLQVRLRLYKCRLIIKHLISSNFQNLSCSITFILNFLLDFFFFFGKLTIMEQLKVNPPFSA